MPQNLVLDGSSLTIADVVRVARDPGIRIALAPEARAALAASRARVDAAVATGATMYGINTGFGKLANVRIAPEQLEQLQINLIRSHAAGVGALMPADVVRAVMVLRANVLVRPTSGVRPDLVDALRGTHQQWPCAGGAGAGKRRRERRPGAAQSHRTHAYR